ncbi:MAG: DEAD/DEAH box helicase [Cytophagales bacterium]|nr:DEAD/DEAH box helicase [Cytophagales bacterium]
MSFENLKFNKQLLTALEVAGITAPTAFQSKIIPRILGGQELICIAPEGSGRTTALACAVLTRIKFSDGNIPPRALVLVPTKEDVMAMVVLFKQLAEHMSIRIMGLYSNAGIEGQKEALAEGTDIVVGTPDRVLALYLRSGINLNKLQQFILDDAERIVKQGLAQQIHEISVGLPRCQKVIFTEVMHEKLERMTSAFFNFPTTIEVEPDESPKIETINQVLYQVPNFKTKQNLLNLLMSDSDTFKKVVVFVNTSVTATNIYKSLNKRFPEEVVIIKPSGDIKPERQIVNFMKTEFDRIMVVINESIAPFGLQGLDYIFHFDIPETKTDFLHRVEASQFEKEAPTAISFATDAEMPMIKKIELTTGNKMEIEPLPFGLVIEGTRKRVSGSKDEKTNVDLPISGQGAFQEKKASNAKTYNYGWKEKNKLFGKKNRK